MILIREYQRPDRPDRPHPQKTVPKRRNRCVPRRQVRRLLNAFPERSKSPALAHALPIAPKTNHPNIPLKRKRHPQKHPARHRRRDTSPKRCSLCVRCEVIGDALKRRRDLDLPTCRKLDRSFDRIVPGALKPYLPSPWLKLRDDRRSLSNSPQHLVVDRKLHPRQ